MKTQHTPGPWYKRQQGSEIEIKSGIYTIGMVHNYNEPHEANEANANIIEAAPDMFEALIEILPYAEEFINSNHPSWKKAKAAIAKAKGEKEETA
jgi:hypothetical protein